MFPLKEFRDKAKSFPDILNYNYLIDDGILLNKDGSLTAGFKYLAGDISSMTINERNALSIKINAILAKLGNGWAIQVDSTRRKVENYMKGETHYDNKIAQILENERRLYFKNVEHYDNLLTIIFTYLPPNKNISKFTDLMIIDEENKKNQGEKILEYFKSTIEDLERSLGIYVQIQRLKSYKKVNEDGEEIIYDDLLSFINFSISGNVQEIRLPQTITVDIDFLIGSKEFYTGLQPKIENKFIGIVAIDGFPSESYPNLLNQLTELAFDYRFNSRFVFLDQFEAEKMLKKERKKWQQKTKGFLDQLLDRPTTKVDQHAMLMVQEIDNATMELKSGLLNYGYYTANILIFDENSGNLNDKIKVVKSVLETKGFMARVESINATEAYLGSLPAHIYPNLRRPIVNTLNLAHLIPLASIWSGEQYNPCDKYPPQSPCLIQTVTSGQTPFRLNLHVFDIGHTLIFGPTGAGKSVLLANLLLNFQKYKSYKVFAFDKGRSLMAPTLGTNGTHYDIGGDGAKLAFAPLSKILKKDEKEKAWAENWVETCLRLQGINPNPLQKKIIHEAIESHVSGENNSLTDFVAVLQDNELRNALSPYTISGKFGYLLDAEKDGLDFKSGTITFEIEELMDLGEEAIIPTLLYIFHKIEQSLRGQPTLLILDEAWIALGHPVFKNKIVEWLKVLRKANCAVVLATQSLSDSAKSGILDVLQESCPTKIFLPNPEAFNKGSDNTLGPYDFYKNFGLNDVQIGIISNAIKKREYYYYSPLGTRLFNLALAKANLCFTASSDKISVKRISELHEKLGETWAFEWLKEKGVNYENYLQIDN